MDHAGSVIIHPERLRLRELIYILIVSLFPDNININIINIITIALLFITL